MADKNRFMQVFRKQQAHDIVDMRIEIDPGMDHMGVLAHPRQRRRMDQMALGLQQPNHGLIAPAAMAAAMYQYEGRHFISPRSIV
jgi:hypothetical protein